MKHLSYLWSFLLLLCNFIKRCCRKREAVYWVIEESETIACCVAVKFYNQQDELLHIEHFRNRIFDTLNTQDLQKIRQKAAEIRLKIL